METRLTSLEQLMPLPTAGELLAANPQRLVVVSPEAGSASAVKLMRENDIGFLPVVEGGKLVAVLSERDIVRRVSLQHPTFVHQMMNTRVHSVRPDATVPECLALMHRERVRHLPVLDGDAILGVLSVHDFTGALIERHERLLKKLQQERVSILFPYSSSY